MVYRVLLLSIIIFSNIYAENEIKSIKNFKADFLQTVTNQSNNKIEYTGEIFIKDSIKALWKYKTPIIKNVYLTGTLVIVDEPELEQAIYTNLETSINITKLLESAQKIDENKYKSKLYEREYFILLKNNQIQSLSFEDELENKISIVFKNIVENIDISDDTFKFLPPDYYDVIRK